MTSKTPLAAMPGPTDSGQGFGRVDAAGLAEVGCVGVEEELGVCAAVGVELGVVEVLGVGDDTVAAVRGEPHDVSNITATAAPIVRLSTPEGIIRV